MTKLLKEQHVLLCGEITDLSLQIVDILFKNQVKSITITNNNGDIFNEFQNKYENNRLYHIPADLNKIEDLEEVYKITLNRCKKIDIVINNKELMNDDSWEDEITMQINSMICSTLLAMKHVGKMNGGRGCKVINTTSLFNKKDSSCENVDCISTNYESIKNLLTDLDQSFGNAYYYANTGVKILTMCSYMEIQSDIEQTYSVPQGSTYIFARFDNVEKRLLAVITDKVSDLQEYDKKQVKEEFQIVVEPNK